MRRSTPASLACLFDGDTETEFCPLNTTAANAHHWCVATDSAQRRCMFEWLHAQCARYVIESATQAKLARPLQDLGSRGSINRTRLLMILRLLALGCAFLGLATQTAWAAPLDTSIRLHQTGTSTYYVAVALDDSASDQFLVDTGSSYVAINKATFRQLSADSRRQRIRQLSAVMADGSEAVVPVYRVPRLTLGGRCVLHDVEVAVLPGTTRNILGMNALRKAAPFAISVSPPSLMLSGCRVSDS